MKHCNNCDKTILEHEESWAGDINQLCQCCVHDQKPVNINAYTLEITP